MLILRCNVRQCRKLIEPSVGDDDVIVEKNEVFTARVLKTLVDGRGETAIGGVGDDGDRNGRGVLNAGKVFSGAVGRSVVDNDQLPVGPGLPEKRRDALPGELELVPALCGELRYVASGDGCPGIPQVRNRVRHITGRSYNIVGPSPFPHFLEVRQCLSNCSSVPLR